MNVKALFISHAPRRLRGVTLGYGVILFLWLTPEDSIWLAAALGAGLSLLASVHLLFRLVGGRTLSARQWFAGMVGLSALCGAGTAPAAALLMLVKVAAHSHAYPDYPVGVFAGIFQRLPLWTAAGALAGLALALIFWDRL
jgi:hypothetical protein